MDQHVGNWNSNSLKFDEKEGWLWENPSWHFLLYLFLVDVMKTHPV
jgi:hypothetical protein